MMEQYGLTLAAIESDLNENREERFIAAFHTFTGLCYLLLASQLVFVKENPAPFRDKRRQMREITDTEPYRSVIAGNQGIHQEQPRLDHHRLQGRRTGSRPRRCPLFVLDDTHIAYHERTAGQHYENLKNGSPLVIAFAKPREEAGLPLPRQRGAAR